jgi:hypothetical protein
LEVRLEGARVAVARVFPRDVCDLVFEVGVPQSSSVVRQTVAVQVTHPGLNHLDQTGEAEAPH